MDAFGLRIENLDCKLPVRALIKKSEFERCAGLAALEVEYRAKCRDLLLRARRRRKAMFDTASLMIERSIEDAYVHIEELARRSQEVAVEDAVVWLIEEHQVERRIIEKLRERCRETVVDVVGQFAGEADRSELILKRVAAHFDGFAKGSRLELKVPNEIVESMRNRCVEFDGLEVVGDSGLQGGQARLDSEYVQIRIDIDKHLAELTARVLGGTQIFAT